MTLGLQSTGAAGAAEDLTSWDEVPPRDEFFWINEVNKATLLTNKKKGLLTESEACNFGKAVTRVEANGNIKGNPRPKMYIRYEPLVVKEAGLTATLMHAGRSSQDIHATFQRAMMRDSTLRLMKALLAVRQGFLKLVEDNPDVLIPCYTNGVAAQPSSLAHVLLAHTTAFARDFDRSLSAYARLNECPMGACVLNGTGWPLDRQGMSDYLGFDRPVANTFDAGQVGGTDVMIDAAIELVHPMLHISQFIAEIMQQYAQPRPWILVSATYASSAMPQKRNPGPIIDVRRDASAVLGSLNSVIMRAHNLPTGMYDAKDEKLNMEMLDDAVKVVEAFATLLSMLRIDKDRALEELNLDWTASQELADVLMRKFGIPFRVGHGFASRMVTVARNNQWTPKDFPLAEARKIYEALRDELKEELPSLPSEFPFDEKGFRAVLSPAHIVAERAVDGGPQPDSLLKLKIAGQELLNADEMTLNRLFDQLQEAQSKLHKDFGELIA